MRALSCCCLLLAAAAACLPAAAASPVHPDLLALWRPAAAATSRQTLGRRRLAQTFDQPPSPFTLDGFAPGFGGLFPGGGTLGGFGNNIYNGVFRDIFNAGLTESLAAAIPDSLPSLEDFLPPDEATGSRVSLRRGGVVSLAGFDAVDRRGGAARRQGGARQRGRSIPARARARAASRAATAARAPTLTGGLGAGYQYQATFGSAREATLGGPPGEYNFGAAVNVTVPWIAFSAQLNRVANDFGVQQWYQFVGQLILNEARGAARSGEGGRGGRGAGARPPRRRPRPAAAHALPRGRARTASPPPPPAPRVQLIRIQVALGPVLDVRLATAERNYLAARAGTPVAGPVVALRSAAVNGTAAGNATAAAARGAASTQRGGGGGAAEGAAALAGASADLLQRIAGYMGLPPRDLADGMRRAGLLAKPAPAPASASAPRARAPRTAAAAAAPARNATAAGNATAGGNATTAASSAAVKAPTPSAAGPGGVVVSTSKVAAEGDAGLLAELDKVPTAAAAVPARGGAATGAAARRARAAAAAKATP
ncbi:hypothetical protein HT031_000761 [Scenedesmus sp. PABB004]|nr:hypothetical protein HT031_000761 [Scenedesmus sp. PABB004]